MPAAVSIISRLPIIPYIQAHRLCMHGHALRSSSKANGNAAVEGMMKTGWRTLPLVPYAAGHDTSVTGHRAALWA